MQHRRSIDLIPHSRTSPKALPITDVVLADLPSWCILVATCPVCSHRAEVNRHLVTKKLGGTVSLFNIQKALRCTGCQNRHGNRLDYQSLPR